MDAKERDFIFPHNISTEFHSGVSKNPTRCCLYKPSLVTSSILPQTINIVNKLAILSICQTIHKLINDKHAKVRVSQNFLLSQLKKI